MKFIFIDGINNNDCVVRYNKLNAINIIALQIASNIASNGYSVRYMHYDTASPCMLRLCVKRDSFLFLHLNKYNTNAVLSFIKSTKKSKDKILLYSFEEDLSDSLDSNFSYINIKEKESLSTILVKIAALCNLNIKTVSSATNYKLVDTLSKKTPIISVGEGCDRNCSFCNNAANPIKYRGVDTVINEIKYLLSHNSIYFHIYNHSFASNPSFVSAFCNKLIENFNWQDYAWSCFIIPETFEKNISLLPLMAKAGLKKITIGLEGVSTIVQNSFNLPNVKESTKKIVSEAIKCGIVNIEINIIIGSIYESLSTLDETKIFIDELITSSSGLCDIILNCYYLNTSDFQNAICPKQEVLQPSLFLSRDKIAEWINQTKTEIDELQKAMVYKTSLKQRHSVFSLSNYGIYSNIFFLALNRSLLAYSYKPYHYYSYEIETEKLQEYSPVFIGRQLYTEDNNITVCIDKCLCSKTTSSLIFPSRLKILFEILPQKLALKEIATALNGNLSEDEICNTLFALENYHLLYFIKKL